MKKNSYKLTVIMSTYNESKKELDNSINSIINQTFSNFKFIIVDDNPESYSLKKYLLYKSSKDNRIYLIFNRVNLGLVNSLNRAIKHVHSNLVARMDADDISLPNRFESQINFMRENDLDLSFTNSESIYNNKLNSQGVFFNKNIINQQLLKYVFYNYGNISLHSTWMLKKEVYTKLHGYRNVLAAEDFDFLIRAITLGFKLGYQAKVLFIWRRRKNGISKENAFSQYISSQLLHKCIRKYNYKKIVPMKRIIYIQNKKITNASSKRYNLFLKCGHNVKYHFSIISLLKFMFASLESLNAIKYLYGFIISPLMKRHVKKIVENQK